MAERKRPEELSQFLDEMADWVMDQFSVEPPPPSPPNPPVPPPPPPTPPTPPTPPKDNTPKWFKGRS